MIKTIKVKKKIQLDKLIRHVWDYEYFPIRIISDKGNAISFGNCGQILGVENTCNYDDLFEVEVEEEITEDMEFGYLIEVRNYGDVLIYYETSIEEMRTESSRRFYILLDGELVKIWERE